jgi:hypothetical protein
VSLPKLKSPKTRIRSGGNNLPKKNEVSISSEPVYKKQPIKTPPKKQKKPVTPKA